MNRWMERQKKRHRNIFHIKNGGKVDWFNVFFLGCVMTAVGSTLNVFFPNTVLSGWIMVPVYAVVLGIYTYVLRAKDFNPYGRTEHFTGLYAIRSLEDGDMAEDLPLMNRDTEVKKLTAMIDSILPQQKPIRAVCLTGVSGCGKSTILHLLARSYAGNDAFVIKNYSDSYEYMKSAINKDFGDNPSQKLGNKKAVIIFDQFERYFMMPSEVRSQIEDAVRKLAVVHAVIIFSLREEYFLPFILKFDINNLSELRDEGGRTQNTMNPSGSGGLTGRICGADNLLVCAEGGNLNNDEQHLQELCKQAFCNYGYDTEIYKICTGMPLIEKQIIFSMLEREKKDGSDYMALLDDNGMHLMKRYYDVQLATTNDYFNASRIMYLLCIGRMHNIVFSNDEVRDILCIPESGREENEYTKCLKQLESRQLIQKVERDTESHYEIAHDFIADSYEAYAQTEMNMEVKAAIDEYQSAFRRHSAKQMNSADNTNAEYYRKMRKKTRGGWAVMCTAMAAGVLESGALRLIWNHAVSPVVLILALLCLVYAFGFFMYVTRYFRGSGKAVIRILLAGCVIAGFLSVYYDAYWIQFLGAGTVFTGLSALIIGMAGKLTSKGKGLFVEYGGRTMLMGGLLIVLGFLLPQGSVLIDGTDVTSWMKGIAMSALLAYSMFSHINNEYYYARLAAIMSGSR